MELDELKSTWQALEKALERTNRLNAAMLRQQKLHAVHGSLRSLWLNQAFQIIVGVLFIALAGLLWSTKPTALSVIVGGVTVQAYGIGCIVTAGGVFSSLHRIDYAATVVAVQDGLARVRRAYGICVLVAGLSWWFLWVPILMVLAALVHINLYAHAPSVIWIGMGTGIAGVAGTYGMYRYSQRSSSARVRRFVELAMFGRGLQKALSQLDEIRRFEQELQG